MLQQKGVHLFKDTYNFYSSCQNIGNRQLFPDKLRGGGGVSPPFRKILYEILHLVPIMFVTIAMFDVLKLPSMKKNKEVIMAEV